MCNFNLKEGDEFGFFGRAWYYLFFSFIPDALALVNVVEPQLWSNALYVISYIYVFALWELASAKMMTIDEVETERPQYRFKAYVSWWVKSGLDIATVARFGAQFPLQDERQFVTLICGIGLISKIVIMAMTSRKFRRAIRNKYDLTMPTHSAYVQYGDDRYTPHYVNYQ